MNMKFKGDLKINWREKADKLHINNIRMTIKEARRQWTNIVNIFRKIRRQL